MRAARRAPTSNGSTNIAFHKRAHSPRSGLTPKNAATRSALLRGVVWEILQLKLRKKWHRRVTTIPFADTGGFLRLLCPGDLLLIVGNSVAVSIEPSGPRLEGRDKILNPHRLGFRQDHLF